MSRPEMGETEVRAGLLAGRRLIQEEWSTAAEIELIDKLVVEGIARATPWEWSDNYQCERRYVIGITKAA